MKFCDHQQLLHDDPLAVWTVSCLGKMFLTCFQLSFFPLRGYAACYTISMPFYGAFCHMTPVQEAGGFQRLNMNDTLSDRSDEDRLTLHSETDL